MVVIPAEAGRRFVEAIDPHQVRNDRLKERKVQNETDRLFTNGPAVVWNCRRLGAP